MLYINCIRKYCLTIVATVIISGEILFLPARGFSQSPGKKQADEEFERGSILFTAGAYKDALEKFQSSYKLNPQNEVLYYMGLCYVQLGEKAKAVKVLQDYVVAESEKISKSRGREIAVILEQMMPQIGVIYLTAEEKSAEVIIDDEKVGFTPLKTGIYVEPGTHKILVKSIEGKVWSNTIQLKTGETVEFNLTSQDLQIKDESRVERSSGEEGVIKEQSKQKRRKISPVLWGSFLAITVASGIAGVVTGAMSLSKVDEMDDLDRECIANGCNSSITGYEDYLSKKSKTYDESKILADATTGLLIGSGAFAIITIALSPFVFSSEKKEKEKKISNIGLGVKGGTPVLVIKF